MSMARNQGAWGIEHVDSQACPHQRSCLPLETGETRASLRKGAHKIDMHEIDMHKIEGNGPPALPTQSTLLIQGHASRRGEYEKAMPLSGGVDVVGTRGWGLG